MKSMSNNPSLIAIKQHVLKEIGLNPDTVSDAGWRRIILSRMVVLKISTISEYHTDLIHNEEELKELIELLVVPETWFFRDQDVYHYLFHYLQKLNRENPNIHLRILSVPCSSGEEPYSIAMTLLEAGYSTHSFTIDAVDISHSAIMKAHKGIYTTHSFRGVAPFNVNKHFHLHDTLFHVSPNLKQLVKFHQENILNKDFIHRKSYDIIFCRNLIIYLSSQAQKKFATILDTLLKPEGLLFVANAEADSLIQKGFKLPLTEKAFLLMKKEAAKVQKLLEKEDISNKVIPFHKKYYPDKSQPILLVKALAMADVGDYKQAEDIVHLYLKKNKLDPHAYFILGLIKHASGEEKTAEMYFNKTIFLDPNHREALIYLSLLSEKNGEPNQALQYKKRSEKAEKRLIYEIIRAIFCKRV